MGSDSSLLEVLVHVFVNYLREKSRMGIIGVKHFCLENPYCPFFFKDIKMQAKGRYTSGGIEKAEIPYCVHIDICIYTYIYTHTH